MPGSILVADSNFGFAGMLQQAIVEAGFTCQTAATAREAINMASSSQISLAIIALDLPDAVPAALVSELRRASPGIILLGILPEEETKAREVPSLGLQGTLTKPFYMPDFIPQLKTLLSEPAPAFKEASAPELLAAEEKLLEMLGIGGAEKPVVPAAAEMPPTSEGSAPRELAFPNATQASAAMARLMAGTATRASLLVLEDKLFSFAGELPSEHAAQAARLVAGGWSRHERGVWLRYFRLAGTEEDFLLYSTPAGGKYILALVFPSPTPVREARSATHAVLEGLHRAGPAAGEEPRMDAIRPGKTAVLRSREGEPVQSVAVPGKTRRLDARKAARATAAAQAASPAAAAAPQRAASAARRAPGAPAAAPASPPASGEAARVRLNYNIVLTPADPTQRLLPEIASDLEGFVRSLIAGRGWRAQRITVRPDHCLISLSAPASSSPSDIIRVLRGETSAHILARLAPAGGAPAGVDFWTATHLLTTQEQPPTPGQIANFIAQTRKSQTPPPAPASG